MEQIGFVGINDKKDLLLNVAKTITKLNRSVLIVDATMMQRLRYIVPKVSSNPTYVSEYDGVDVAVGFLNLMQICSYLNMPNLNYDYILIDCPPSLGILTLECLCAADSFLVPMQTEYYALEGLSQLMATVRSVQKGLNKNIRMEGILLTMYDGRTNLAVQVVEEVKKHFGERVYSTVIPRNVRLSEAPSHGQPITTYDKLCRGAEAYISMAEEFLKKNIN